MKAITCPQCGSLIKNISPHQPIGECGYCGAKVVTAIHLAASPEPYDEETARFRAVERPVRPRPPIQPIFIAVSGIGIFMFLMFSISLIPLKTHFAAPLPLKPIVFPTPSRQGADKIDRPATLDRSQIPTVSYCDLTRAAVIYDGKIVRLRAVYDAAFEKTYLYDERCQTDRTPSAPENVPAETWARRDKSFNAEGDSDEAKLNRRLNGFGRRDVTVVGKFQSAGERGGGGAPNRFGHLNCCRYQFSIMRVEAVVESGDAAGETPHEYGKTVKFAAHQKINFANFTLEYFDEFETLDAVPQPAHKLPTGAFRAERASQSVMIYVGVEKDDGAPLEFAIGGGKYQLETGFFDKSGKLARDELVVRKIN